MVNTRESEIIYQIRDIPFYSNFEISENAYKINKKIFLNVLSPLDYKDFLEILKY